MIRLLGPVPFDTAAAGRAARSLLSRLATAPAEIPVGQGSLPGLYLVMDDSGALRGFWVTLGASWLDEGTVGGVTPPFAKALLDAATEELWWARFQVAPMVLGAWRPLIIVEWPASLADRSSLAPPGVPAEVDPAADPTRRGPSRWLVPDGLEESVASEIQQATSARWAHLPPARSLLCIVRGSLRWTRAVHEGRFELVYLAEPEAEGLGIGSMPASWTRDGLPPDEWIEIASGQATRPEGEHQLGHPLQLPGGRIGFPMSGWLSRELDIHPSRPIDAAVGQLVSRDTRSQVLAQATLAAAVTAWVLMGTLAFSGGLRWLSQPTVQGAAPALEPAAQPAFSVCSADHGRFVDQLSCQVEYIAAGGEPGKASCADARHETDLQASWCGLRDRTLDGTNAPSGYPWADAAAAQACFEVLDKPWEYALGGIGDTVANPGKLLEDPKLRVNSLVELVASLDAGCNAYRERMEKLVDGAILAAHVGGEDGEAKALQDQAFAVATQGQSPTSRLCMEAGRSQPIEASTELFGLCGADSAEDSWREVVPWRALGGEPPHDVPSVIDRYVAARFAASPPREGRWACHSLLAASLGGGVSPGVWDQVVPAPESYRSGGSRNQLGLDSWVLASRTDNPPSDVCWNEVARMLAAYTPAHPLLSEPKPDGWPSAEQQVCGQVCTDYFHLAKPSSASGGALASTATAWATPGSDLAACVDRSAPGLGRAGGIDDRFDKLAIPWNRARDGSWVVPEYADVCAFNLLAQGLVPDVLPADLPATSWAGQSVPGSKIAGGVTGAAAQSAAALVEYGRNRSSATCGRVAVQCFVRKMLDVTGDPSLGPQLWPETWKRRVDDLSRASSDDLADEPWCRVIRPFLPVDGRLPEGELDYPCVVGVTEARERVARAVNRFAAGVTEGAKP